MYMPYQNEHTLYEIPFELFDEISCRSSYNCIASLREFSYEFLKPILPRMIFYNLGDCNGTVSHLCALI